MQKYWATWKSNVFMADHQVGFDTLAEAKAAIIPEPGINKRIIVITRQGEYSHTVDMHRHDIREGRV